MLSLRKINSIERNVVAISSIILADIDAVRADSIDAGAEDTR